MHCALSGPVYAQQGGYTSGHPTAIRLYEMATKYYDTRQNDKALEALNAALDKDPKFVEAWILLGNIYDDQKNYDSSIASYRNAIAIKPDFFPNSYLLLGNAEIKKMKYEEAREHLTKFLTYPNISSAARDLANRLLVSAEYAADAIKHPIDFNPVSMGDSINSEFNEYFPCITADGKTFLFTRRKPIVNKYGRKTEEEDFYVSYWKGDDKKGYWTKAAPLEELNTEGNEGAPALSADGQYLFFIGCEEKYGYPEGREKGYGSCDVYISKKTGNRFGTARNLGPPVNTGSWESQPSFSSDGRTLYFIRAVRNADNKLRHDIYVTTIDDSSRWSVPVPISGRINTLGNEMTVFIHPDDQTLYFSSDGHPGFGGFDIFMSRRQPDGTWGDPVNLGYPINTSGDENSLLISPDGKTAYFASNREDSKGGLDLYQFTLPENVQPQKITYMKGIVFDAETKKPLSASFELIDLETGKPVVRSSSNAGNGEFIVPLPSGKSYALNVAKDGYLFYSDNFELKNSASVEKPFLKDVPLKPIKAGESIVLRNIFYEVDKYELKEESGVELEKLIQFMEKNPKLRVEISGHTDNTGTKQHNQTLSENRAEAVYRYLVAHGIEASRLTFKGYADNKPIASNATEAGRSQNRRTEFTILSVN